MAYFEVQRLAVAHQKIEKIARSENLDKFVKVLEIDRVGIFFGELRF